MTEKKETTAEKPKSSLAALKVKAADHAARARAIQAKIREMENEQYLKVGRFVADLYKGKWGNFEEAAFKKSVVEILEC